MQRQGGTTQIGIVAFAGFAEIVQAPTNDQEVLLDVIGSLATGRRTAVGSAILEAINAIAEIDPSIARAVDPEDPTSTATAPPAVPKGAYAPAIIVLLTDGASNAGPDPVEAAQQAADRGLRIYTIGYGTDNPGSTAAGLRLPVHRARTGRQRTGPGLRRVRWGIRRDRRRVPARHRRGTLNAVADATDGKYYPAESADQLDQVLASLPTNLITSHEVVEISVAFTAIGVVLIALAIFLGQRWRPLP